MSIILRQARPEDAATIYAMIYELAVYEKAPEEVVTTPEEIRETLFGTGTKTEALIAECEGKFDPLFHSFTHADDASAAEVHPYSSCGMQGFQLLFLCMRGTERVEVGRSRFEVTVVPGHSGIIQCLQLFFVQQSERSAQPDRRMATHPPGRYTELFHVFGRRFASTGHQ